MAAAEQGSGTGIDEGSTEPPLRPLYPTLRKTWRGVQVWPPKRLDHPHMLHPPAEKPAAARSRRGGRSGYAPVEAREASLKLKNLHGGSPTHAIRNLAKEVSANLAKEVSANLAKEVSAERERITEGFVQLSTRSMERGRTLVKNVRRGSTSSKSIEPV